MYTAEPVVRKQLSAILYSAKVALAKSSSASVCTCVCAQCETSAHSVSEDASIRDTNDAVTANHATSRGDAKAKVHRRV
jgi:hypothetical protein